MAIYRAPPVLSRSTALRNGPARASTFDEQGIGLSNVAIGGVQFEGVIIFDVALGRSLYFEIHKTAGIAKCSQRMAVVHPAMDLALTSEQSFLE